MQQLRRRESDRCVAGDGGVGASHGCAIYAPDQSLDGGQCLRSASCEIEAVDDYRVVAREEATVVVEHAQVQSIDLWVGGVHVDNVGLSASYRFERELVLDPAHVAQGKTVAFPQPAPSVRAAEELVSKRRTELGTAHEVGNRSERKLVCDRWCRRNRIGIVKAQRFRDAETVACETGAYLVSRRVGRVKQHFAERARVLGVNVNRARPRGSSDNLRSAEVCAVDSVAAGAARHCRKRLAEDPGLRKRFRTYNHALARLHLPRGERGEKEGDRAKKGVSTHVRPTLP